MNCRQAQRELSALQDGRTGAEAKKALELHLKTCVRCRAYAEEIEASWEMLKLLPGPEPVPYFLTRLKARLSTGRKSRAAWFERLLVPGMAVVMIVLGVWMGSVVMRNGTASAADTAASEENPSLQHIDHLQDFPESSFGHVYADLAALQ